MANTYRLIKFKKNLGSTRKIYTVYKGIATGLPFIDINTQGGKEKQDTKDATHRTIF